MIRIENIKIDEEFFNLLIQFLNNITGLNLEYYRREFVERRIKARMIRVNCSTLESYYYYLLENSFEIDKFLDGFNVNYSIFFRNWEVFQQFQTLLIKSLGYKKSEIICDLKPNLKRNNSARSKNPHKSRTFKIFQNSRFKPTSAKHFLEITSLYKKIRSLPRTSNYVNIWSCPCASGQEPFSIAIILDNLKNKIPNFPQFKLIASDIDRDAIDKAKIGIYSETSMTSVSEFIEDKYFRKRKEFLGYKYILDEDIKNNIEFLEEDLTKGHKTSLMYDIIFSRYLLIYISNKTREKFLNIIKSHLNYGGLLILGKTETLFNTDDDLMLIDSFNRIYLKLT